MLPPFKMIHQNLRLFSSMKCIENCILGSSTHSPLCRIYVPCTKWSLTHKNRIFSPFTNSELPDFVCSFCFCCPKTKHKSNVASCVVTIKCVCHRTSMSNFLPCRKVRSFPVPQSKKRILILIIKRKKNTILNPPSSTQKKKIIIIINIQLNTLDCTN